MFYKVNNRVSDLENYLEGKGMEMFAYLQIKIPLFFDDMCFMQKSSAALPYFTIAGEKNRPYVGWNSCSLVAEESLFGHLLVFRPRTAVVGVGVDADASPGGEEARDLDVFGVHEADEVLHDDVDAVFVEITVVAEGEEVELEALALHHAAVGEVGDAYLRKVGLTRDGTETGELGAVEAHPVVVFGVLILKGFKHFRGIVLAVLGLLAQELKTFIGTGGHG